jgi:hypothetical protein
VLVGEGVVTGADSDSVGIGTGTTAVVDSVEDVAELALSVALVIADSAEPDVAELSEAPVVDEESVVVDASDAPEVAVDASAAPDVVVAVSEAPEVVVGASEAPDVADALESVEVAVAVPDVASPYPVVLVTLSSPEVVIGTGTIGTVVLLASEAVSVELLEETLEGLSVGASVDSSTAVAEVEMPVPTELSVALVVTGTGMAVVPSVPVDVLRL